ncbi:MAG: c-type cytochrome [Methylotenera sp.]|uniref:c-type cytochrome n=1 Tax=Methylotenera sp. TaxID=2051956 RepID=UPI0017C7390D|nr:c-type cytochrome [Methylotenera sp.]NOU24477.1 c-type cytochrome [Methylotenera sp.]
MSKYSNSALVLVLVCALAACGKSGSDASGGSTKEAAAGVCNLVSTKDNSPLAIKVVATDTPEAKEFLATCVNPYTKKYAADAEAAKAGRKVMTYNGCTGCHGGNLGGLMAPSLVKNGGTGAFDTKWVYEKNATDKGMFETIAGGTPGTSGGTMFVWHNQLPGKTGEGLPTDDILKAVAYIRTVYKGDGEKTWLK